MKVRRSSKGEEREENLAPFENNHISPDNQES
jgi:hypothetical protein